MTLPPSLPPVAAWKDRLSGFVQSRSPSPGNLVWGPVLRERPLISMPEAPVLLRGSRNTATRTWEARAGAGRGSWSRGGYGVGACLVPSSLCPVILRPRHVVFLGGAGRLETLVGHTFEPLIPNGLCILRPGWRDGALTLSFPFL